MTDAKLVLETSYIPEQDKTVIWQHLYIKDELFQTILIGWYFGEPDEKTTKDFSYHANVAQFL